MQLHFMPKGMIVLGLTTLSLSACRVGKNAGDGDSRVLGLQTEDATAAQTPKRVSCSGISPYKIVGGQSAAEDTQVSAATLKLVIKGQKYCSATLIGDQHIVTAAHCLAEVKDPADIKIGSGLDGKIQDKLIVDSFTVHPRFVGVLGDDNGYLDQPFYDVAAIHFTGTLPSSLKPVGIATPGEIQVGRTAIVSGYGAYGSDDKSRRPLSLVETRLAQISPDLMELQITANDGRGACFGDSGGPTFIIDSASSCLLLVGSTTGPGRDSETTCESGGATLMDLTRYQSWLACAFKNLNQPASQLICDSK